MKIRLDELTPSPNQVRTSWNEQEMLGLTTSFLEQGQIVPIKVRLVKGEYEVVYGHRRVCAARAAGLTYIEAIVEDLNDAQALIQTLIENLHREDLSPLDAARGLKALQEKTHWSFREMERQGILSHVRISQLLALLEEPKEVRDLLEKDLNLGGNPVSTTHKNAESPAPAAPSKKPITEKHIRETRHSGLSEEERVQVLRDAREEGWTVDRTKAEAKKKAEPDLAVRAFLEEQEKHEEKIFWETHVGGMADEMRRAISSSRSEYKRCMGRIRKFPKALPAEHIPYIESRMRKQGEWLIGLADELEAKRIKEIS